MEEERIVDGTKPEAVTVHSMTVVAAVAMSSTTPRPSPPSLVRTPTRTLSPANLGQEVVMPMVPITVASAEATVRCAMMVPMSMLVGVMVLPRTVPAGRGRMEVSGTGPLVGATTGRKEPRADGREIDVTTALLANSLGGARVPTAGVRDQAVTAGMGSMVGGRAEAGRRWA